MTTQKRFYLACLFSVLPALFTAPAQSADLALSLPQLPEFLRSQASGGVFSGFSNPLKNPPVRWVGSRYGEKPTIVVLAACPSELLFGISPPPVAMFHQVTDVGISIFNNSEAPFQIQKVCTS